MRLGDGLRTLGEMDRLAAQDTPIHRVDPRAKVATVLLFLVLLASHPPTALSALLPYALFPVALASAGCVPASLIFRRILMALPFVLLLAGLNPLLDREPALQVGSHAIARGWLSLASVSLRGILAVATATALTATTGMGRLCQGLEGLGAPRALVIQISFLYRYAFLLLEEGLRMQRAWELRAQGKPPGLRAAAQLLGHLLLRAWDRGTRIHAAMRARGFEGHLASLRLPALRFRDVRFALGWACAFCLFRWVDLPAWLGARVIP